MIQKIIISICFVGWLIVANAQSTISIIPQPVEVKVVAQHSVVINQQAVIHYFSKMEPQAKYLQEQIYGQAGMQLSLKKISDVKNLPKSGILIWEDLSAVKKSEMYLLNSSEGYIKISARDVRGFINAFQTLLQLIPIKQQSSISIPAVSITDYPQFRYRGMHLDVVRHIFPMEYIKKYIDYLTFHKFNTF
ncbi:MAG TPA: glycoside hydrolase family 20 zincin-like fold domain-containing protein, partial [Lacibacter sp.]|nr:glycoside hydrolase family 20 zincin-like fold domain-containing protein [Lacibacter sp.]